MDVEATHKAVAQASTLFLLNAVTPDELAQALLTLRSARDQDRSSQMERRCLSRHSFKLSPVPRV